MALEILNSYLIEANITARKVAPRQDDAGLKVVGSNPGAVYGFFSRKISIKLNLHGHLALEFVH